jgi:hypothetical protein
VAVIGAAGSIGRLAALHAGRHARRLVLIGNPRTPGAADTLSAIAGEVYRKAAHIALLQADAGLPQLLLEAIGPTELICLLETIPESALRAFGKAIEERLARKGMRRAPIVVSCDLAAELGKAGVVLSASGAGKAFVDPRLLAPGAIVCDVARPLDVLSEVKSLRHDVFVYEGGVIQLPENVSFGAQNVLGYPRGYNLACLSETMVLAMEGAHRHHSLGNMIDYDEALHIHDRARQHGFGFAVLVDGVPCTTRPPRPAVERRVQVQPVLVESGV